MSRVACSVLAGADGAPADTQHATRSTLTFRNRQHDRRLKLPFVRRVLGQLLAPRSGGGREVGRHGLRASASLTRRLPSAGHDLCFHFVSAEEMARVNGQFLQHEGSTDVITFDYADAEAKRRNAASAQRERRLDLAATPLHGEAFICVADAVKQSREFKTTWQSEVIRYAVHAVLHLRGYDDLQPAKRRVMKREENRLVRELASAFDFEGLEMKSARR